MASRPPPRAGRKVESPGGPPIPPPALTVRFAGDAGDGVTLLGARLAAAGRAGYAVATRADPPGEIRSVPGAQAGVHAVQVRVGPPPALVPGPAADLLVALNPAAAAVYGPLLSPGGEVVVNTDAGPVPPGPARGWPLTTLTRAAVAPCKLSARDAGRCTHFFVLGVTLAYAGLPADEALGWVRRTLADNPPAADAAGRAVRAGLAFGTDQFGPAGKLGPPGPNLPASRLWSGLDAVAAGLMTAADRAGVRLVVAGSPAPPTGGLLDVFGRPEYRRLGVRVTADADPAGVALGAGYGGALGVAVTAGDGLTAAAGVVALAGAAGVPLVLVHAPRPTRGPGLPRPADQGDLLAAVHGRAGAAPAFVLAPRSPADALPTAFAAARLALEHGRPAILLLDPLLAVSGETGPVPAAADFPAFAAAPRPVPGTPGGEHRLGADPPAPAALPDPPAVEVAGPAGGLLVLSWGTASAAARAAAAAAGAGYAHLRHLHPLPAGLPAVVAGAARVVVAEVNGGQLAALVRAACPAVAGRVESVTRADGDPFDPAALAAALVGRGPP